MTFGRMVAAGGSSAGVAFVAGATGYTGRAVVSTLVSQNVRTIAHVRPDSKRLHEFERRFEDEGAEVVDTPWDVDAMSAALAELRPTLVFALLGTTKARARAALRATGRTETYDSIDYGLTSLLLRAARACGSRPKVVYLSAAGVRGGARGAYYAARVKAEAEIRDSGLPYVIARPSFITGEDRDESRPLERVGASVSDALLGAAGVLGARRLRDRYRSNTNGSLARALVRLALDVTETASVVESERLHG